jgi:hypothetical protein
MGSHVLFDGGDLVVTSLVVVNENFMCEPPVPRVTDQRYG